MVSKRKGEAAKSASPAKRRNVSDDVAPAQSSAQSAFGSDLFDKETLSAFRTAYKESGPYPHAVVSNLINHRLLRDVRSEATEHIHFTLKETDIYRIHQSGDLANLSNLDADSLKRLPNLVKLRDALYSSDFRQWVSHVTGAGPLSGTRTDMAVNVYLPGCYLLCHDDVIGTRRVSYILYLTDPDRPWKPEWGGGLRLFPTEPRVNTEGEDVKVPLPDHTVNIPPSFSQLSFFAVRPGESYHDVEEVYHRGPQDTSEDGGRVRMAISGWFHIPQEGEDGFEEGIEQAQAQRSTLAQLKSGAQQFDEPQTVFRPFHEPSQAADSPVTKTEHDASDRIDSDPDILTEQDLTFLLHYLTPSYLTPDFIDQFSESFGNTSFLQLDKFFNDKFAAQLKEYITKAEAEPSLAEWPLSRPPHKQRYGYLQSSEPPVSDASPIARVLSDLLPSHAFKKWLALVTAIKPDGLVQQATLARRFRRGKDYALASPYVGEQPQLEFTIGLTPTSGWEREPGVESQVPEYGGEEVYMAGDDDDDDQGSVHSNSLPQVGRKADPAVYKATGDDDDDGILFTNSPSWNTFSLVLRDKGTLRFVKYVSQAAQGDRWDVKAEVQLADDAFDGEDGDDASEDENDQADDQNGAANEHDLDGDSSSAHSGPDDEVQVNGSGT